MKKRIIAIFLSLVIISGLAACGESAEEKAKRETQEAIDSVISMIGGETPSNPSQDADDSQQAGVEVEPEPEPIQRVDLNLPLVVNERTFQVGTTYAWSNYIQISTDNTIGTYPEPWSGTVSVVPPVDNEARSFHVIVRGLGGATILYTKNDNSLWGYGSNENGLLGDGTGVDKDEPVKILDNVAEVGSFEYNWNNNVAYAIKTDKTLWIWGVGNFTPVMVSRDIVKFIDGTDGLFLKSDGALWYYKTMNELESNNVFGITSTQVYDVVGYGNNNNFCWIDEDRNLWRAGNKLPGCDNVVSIFTVFDSGDVLFIKSDSNLWGYGKNANGELGDGTKVPRENSPVKIADDVIGVSPSQRVFIKSDGEVWTWDNNNPTPRKIFDNGHSLINHVSGFFVLLNNGQVYNINPFSDKLVAENVRLSQTLIFE